jgi:hypothetical protein
MSEHCHHYYNENHKAAVLQHDHPYDNVRHTIPELPIALPVYWDHETYNCDGLYDIDGLEEGREVPSDTP